MYEKKQKKRRRGREKKRQRPYLSPGPQHLAATAAWRA